MKIIIIIGIIAVIGYLFSLNIRPRCNERRKVGDIGENIAAEAVLRVIHTRHVHRGVYVPKSGAYWAECDIVAVGKAAVYVIEVKHYAGSVTGNSAAEQWTQCREGKPARKFYNPLRQNMGHIEALKRHFTGLPVLGIVLFTGSADISNVKTDFSSGTASCVTDVSTLEKMLRYTETKYTKIPEHVRTQVTAALKAWSVVSATVKRKHIINAGYAAKRNK